MVSPSTYPSRKRRARFDKLSVFKACMRAAFLKQATFTPRAIANICKCSDTKAFRAFLNSLVDEGFLLRYNVLFADGHHRQVYMGQMTRELPFTYLPTEYEVQHEA